MKHVDEYRDEGAATRLLAAIRARVTRPWTIMEICGGQTHTLIQAGIDEGATLVSGGTGKPESPTAGENKPRSSGRGTARRPARHPSDKESS